MKAEELNKKWQEAKRLEITTKLLNKIDLENERHENELKELNDEIETTKTRLFAMDSNITSGMIHYGDQNSLMSNVWGSVCKNNE